MSPLIIPDVLRLGAADRYAKVPAHNRIENMLRNPGADGVFVIIGEAPEEIFPAEEPIPEVGHNLERPIFAPDIALRLFRDLLALNIKEAERPPYLHKGIVWRAVLLLEGVLLNCDQGLDRGRCFNRTLPHDDARMVHNGGAVEELALAEAD